MVTCICHFKSTEIGNVKVLVYVMSYISLIIELPSFLQLSGLFEEYVTYSLLILCIGSISIVVVG